MPSALLWTSCGTQRLLRPLSGPCILLATAPTAPPCFGRRPQSSPLHHQRKNYLYFRHTGASADAPVCHFHGWGRKGDQHLQRLLPAEAAALRENPLSQSLSALTAPPKGGAFCHLPVSANKAPPSGELDATSGSGLRGFSRTLLLIRWGRLQHARKLCI